MRESLAQPYDPVDLAQGIRWVLEDDERRARLGENARQKVVTHFEMQHVARQYRDLYESLVVR